jgi:hypothetical protein
VVTDLETLTAKIAAQAERIPAMYGAVDFGVTPERFVTDLAVESSLRGELAHLRPSLLADQDQVGRIKVYTMLGDTVADAYAALMPHHGFRRLIAMLTLACQQGITFVEDAPQELVAFIQSMERTPAWLDRALVEEGARLERNASANFAPLMIRGAFLATFLNKYAALPMALTGTLSNEGSARRVRETANFFTTSVMPGALERYGAGFQAAALVRLMHSMVRFNALRSGRWDVSTFGIPIPQVDQMPAGLIGVFLLAQRVLGSGRRTFTPAEQARVEFSRYRCFLLGLPEDLLATTPEGIVKVMSTRQATLRKAFDDSTCGELVRATMSAYLPTSQHWRDRLHNRLERGFGKAFFVKNFMGGSRERAASIGVVLTAQDQVIALAMGAVVAARMMFFALLQRAPLTRRWADAALVRRLGRLLAGYGHAAFTTDAASYRPTLQKAA